jgi:hypothetical protein
MTDDNSDTTVEQLKERIAELESHVYPNRRDVLAAAVGAAGYGAITGTASAAPNYGNATGSAGTDSEPLNEVISKQVTAQTVSTDELTTNELSATIYASADQTLQSGTFNDVSFDSDDDDQRLGDVLSTDLTNDRINIEKAGVYHITGLVTLRSPGVDTRVVGQLAGAETILQENPTGADTRVSADPAGITHITSGDTPANVRMATFHDKGSPVDTLGGQGSVRLSVVRLG